MEFDFQAVQYIDFTSNKDDALKNNCEEVSFFEISHGEHEPLNLKKNDVDESFYTPVVTPRVETKNNTKSIPKEKPAFRRSMSTGNILKPKINNQTNKGVKEVKLKRQTSGTLSNKTSYLRKYTSNENIKKASESKKSDYVSLAEAVRKFHNGTPPRFHSQSGNNKEHPKFPKMLVKPCTQPFSPKLTTKNRSRPTDVMSQEERERLEMEEMSKFKIKAHPLNKKILQGPLKPVVLDKKSPTKPVPFKLTETHKKEEKEEEKFQFHALEVPKSLYQPKAAPKGDARSTIPKPFSFEQRDKEFIKKKEEFVKKVIEEEKKAAVFHANPLPKSIASSKNNSKDSLHKGHEEPKPISPFKARPAKVLQMKPFVPKLMEHCLTEITEFHLNTEKRALEREKFEKQLKEKEQEYMEKKQELEEQMKRLEEAQIAELRLKAVHKAQPIKKYKEVKIVSTNKVTLPRSPKFHRKNKENITQ